MTSLQITNDAVTDAHTDLAAGVTRYVIVEMNASSYGFPTDSTIELMSSSAAAVTRVPKSPRYVRGVINHRGSIIPVVDTRALLGLPTAKRQAEKLSELLAEREREYTAWLDALEHSIRTGDKFDMQTDPAKCAFGRWHKETTSDPRKMQTLARYDQSVRTAIMEMDNPHRRIHRLADTLLTLRAEGKPDEALARLAEERATTFEELRTLFKKVNRAVSKGFRSMLVISELGDRRAAFEVDAVHTVKDCAEDDIETLPDTATGSEFMRGLVHQPDGSYVLICDLARMYELACPR
jgi:chemotaxis signal transduction protein